MTFAFPSTGETQDVALVAHGPDFLIYRRGGRTYYASRFALERVSHLMAVEGFAWGS